MLCTVCTHFACDVLAWLKVIRVYSNFLAAGIGTQCLHRSRGTGSQLRWFAYDCGLSLLSKYSEIFLENTVLGFPAWAFNFGMETLVATAIFVRIATTSFSYKHISTLLLLATSFQKSNETCGTHFFLVKNVWLYRGRETVRQWLWDSKAVGEYGSGTMRYWDSETLG